MATRSGTFHGASDGKKKISPKKAVRKIARVENDLAQGKITFGQAVRREESIGRKSRAQEPLRRVTKSQIKTAKSRVKATRTIARNMNAIAQGRTRESGPIKQAGGRFVV